MTLVNANNDVMGHAAFFDYPNLSSVDQSKWEDWLLTKYDLDKCNVCIYNKTIRCMSINPLQCDYSVTRVT